MTNPDVTRLINSDEIQSVVRPAKAKTQKRPWTQKKNPLVNKGVLFRLNPYAKTLRRQELCTYVCLLPPRLLIGSTVKQERLKKNGQKREKKASAGEAFLATLTAP